MDEKMKRRKDNNPQSSLPLLSSKLRFLPTHTPVMASPPSLVIPFIAVSFLFLSSPSSAQTQNLEATFPSTGIPAFAPGSDPSPPPFPSLPPATSPPQQSSSFPPPSPPGGSGSSVTKAVVGTAFGSFAISGILFFIFYRFTDKRRRQVPDPVVVSPYGKKSDHITTSPYRYSTADAGRDGPGGGGGRGGGGKGGLIVDENGLDVLYLRRLEEGGRGGGAHFCSYCKVELDLDDREDVVVAKRGRRKGGRRVQEMPLMPTGSVRSSDPVSGASSPSDSLSSYAPAKSEPPLPLPPAMAYNQSTQSVPQPSLPPPIMPAQSTPPRLATHHVSASAPPPPPPPDPLKASSAPSPPRPPPPPKAPSPPPPPPPPKAPPPPPPPKAPSAPLPPPPPVGGKKGPPPPPPPRAPGKGPSPPAPPGGAGGSQKPPPVPTGGDGGGTRRAALPPPARLKPLHWDKVTTANVEHSMVWDQIHDGSFRFDDELMIALFGTAAAGARQSTGADKKSSNAESSAPTQIVLLDPRKSQNIAIVLRSLAIGRQEVINSLLDGHGLNSDTLEKLSKITPTKDEEQVVFRYNGDPSKLADAESFLFHLLKSVPAPFARLNHMLFRSSFDNEVLHLKESLRSLDAACKELRSRGLFVKLLEAVLKAGNRMNAGTARGNAQAFNLSSLRKLSDVKSTDGKTTLLHFVVEEVVRSEGKRCIINRNHSLGRTRSKRSGDVGSKNPSSPSTSTSTAAEKEEKEREYMKLGLPVVGGLSVEFANVKRAAVIDFDTMMSSYTTLENRAKSLRHFLSSSKDVGEFAKEMSSFLDTAEQHLKVLGDDKDRVLEVVVRTTEYYLVGSSKDKSAPPLQLFVIVKDFLGMVDQAIVDISRNLQQQQQKQQMKKRAQQQANPAAGLAADQSPPSSGRMSPARFPNLPRHFLSDHSRNSSGSGSDSDDDF